MISSLENISYNELKKILDNKKIEYSEEERKCLKSGMHWDECVEKIRPIAIDIYTIESEMRLKATPRLDFSHKRDGTIIQMEKFVEMAKNGLITDSDGVGYYGTETAISDIRIFCADAINDKLRKDFSVVIWDDQKPYTV